MKKRKLLLFAAIGTLFTAGNLNAQQALDLAGPGNYALAGYTLSGAGFTIEYDMYIHDISVLNGGVTFTCGGGATNQPGPLDNYVTTTGNLNVLEGNCGAVSSQSSATVIAPGTWYNYAYVYNGPGTGISVYINGILEFTLASFSYSVPSATGFVVIGARGDVIPTNAEAKFDNIRIWNTPRSAGEVFDDMTACFNGDEAGLDILYKMEEGTGIILNDLALGNGAQNATVTGTATWASGKTNPILDGAMMNISACDSYTTPSGNHTWTTSGMHFDTIPSTIIGCDSLLTYNLIINSVTNAPTISDAMLCTGDTTLLAANSTVVSEFYIGNPNTTDINDYQDYPSVYGQYYEGAKHQILVLASELTDMGMMAGEINGMEFYVDEIDDFVDPLMGLSIKMAPTTVTELDYTFETPVFTTTYNNALFTVATGAMVHDFSTPFTWDGTSNIVFEICFNNAGMGYTENPMMLYTPTTFNSVSFYNEDDDTGLCSETEAYEISINRPNFKLFGSTATTLWSNATGGIINPAADMTQAVPTATGVYTLDVNNALSGCADNGDMLNVTVNTNPVVDLGTDISQVNPPVTLDAGAGFTTYDWSTGASSQTINVTTGGEYIVTVTNANDCSATDTIQVNFTAGIENLDGSMANINFYPNPAHDFLNMDLTGFNDEVLNVELIDMNGKMLRAFELNNISDNYSTKLDLNDIKDGVYLINISTATVNYSHRIVITKK